jgi:hypothetical protein
MRSKKGTSVPKKGTFVHRSGRGDGGDVSYAVAIAVALRRELGTTHQAVKSVMRWTGASERTVKYWLSGSRGPSGEHLIALAASSETILEIFLRRAGRQNYMVTTRLAEAHEKLKDVVEVLQGIIDGPSGP